MEKAYDIEFLLSGSINPIQDGRRLRDCMGEGVTKSMSLTIINVFALVYFSIHIYHMYQLTL